MNQKVVIGVSATADTSQAEKTINAFGQKIAQANRVQYKPVTVSSIDDVKKMNAALSELVKTQTGLRQRLKATGQMGADFTDWDWKRMYPHAASRGIAMQNAFERVVGAGRFTEMPQAQQPGPGHGAGGGAAGVGVSIAQAGLRAAGPVGGVASGALGAGMSSGFGAGLMGLVGGIAALGVGKLVGAIADNIEKAEQDNIEYDKLKRMLGDVGVSFSALKGVVHSAANEVSITFAEAGKLSMQFAKLSNLSADQYKTLGEEVVAGTGLSRSFGLDPSQGVGILGQMRGMGITANTQESRRFALLLGETIGKSGAFAKAEEVFEAIGGYATSQTRNSMGAANVAGFAGMYSSMVGSGIPGMDPAGAAGLLSRINSVLAGGGAKGEASQFFTGIVGQRMGLSPFQTQVLREGGAFATNDEAFGKDSAYGRFMGGAGPKGRTTFLQGSLDELRRQYGGNKDLLAMATANHLGVNARQAMALLGLQPNQMGEMQDYAGDLTKMSATGIGNLSKALYGSGADRQALRSEFLGRTGDKAISETDRRALQGADTDEKLKAALAAMAARYDQESTTGSDIRDSKNALDNIKVTMADKLVPLTQAMRDGILFMAGGGKKSRLDVMKEIEDLESGVRTKNINGRIDNQKNPLIERQEDLDNKIRSLDRASLAHTYRDRPEVLARKLKELADAEEERARVVEKLNGLEAERAGLLKQENELKAKNIKAIVDASAAEIGGTAPGGPNQSAAEIARLGRRGVAPAAGGAASDRGGYDPLRSSGDARVSSGFGMRVHPITGKLTPHNGIDFAAKEGTPISATADGEVVRSEANKGGFGNLIEIRHADGSVTRYAHNKSNGVKVGQQVKSGEVIGQVGSTGRSTGPHLHYELLKGGRAVDPAAAFESGEHRRPIGNTPAGGLGAGGGSAGAGRGFGYNVTADDITVRIVDDKTGKPMGPPQTIPTRVGPASPYGSLQPPGVTGQW